MELRSLRYFVAVAQELHFGNAAARLNISQPPLTYHIKRLEVELGVLLFERTKRTVKITPAGTALLIEAQRLLDDVENVVHIVRRADEGTIGILRAGFMSSATFAGVGALSQYLARNLPGISITWHGMPTSEQIAQLRSTQLDLGLIHLPADTRGLEIRSIARSELVIAIPASHRLANRKTISLLQLRDESFIMSPRESNPGLHDLIISTCSRVGFNPLIRHRARDLLAIISLISIQDGVSLVPAWLSATTFPNVRFVRLDGTDQPATELGIAWNPDNPSPMLQHTIKSLKSFFKQNAQKRTRRSL